MLYLHAQEAAVTADSVKPVLYAGKESALLEIRDIKKERSFTMEGKTIVALLYDFDKTLCTPLPARPGGRRNC